MKRALLTSILVVASVTCQAQWKLAAGGIGTHVYALGAHDTTSFFMSTGITGSSDPHQLWRFVPSGFSTKWVPADSGIAFSQGNVTSFASIGKYFFGGMMVGTSPRACWRTSDDGLHWLSSGAGGNVCTADRYVFATSNSLARSADSGSYNSWKVISSIKATGVVSSGIFVFAWNSSALWRSTDTGNTWFQLQPPFVGVMTTMDSLLFITASGKVIVSTDTGNSWNPVAVDSAGTPVVVNVLVADGKNLFAGTPYGLLLSTDAGHSWRPENSGLTRCSDVYAMGVFDTLLFIANNIYVGQSNDSVFYRSIPEMIADTGPASVVQNHSPSDSIGIFPNPSMGTITIHTGGTSILSIRVLNVLGEDKIDFPKVNDMSMTFDLSKLSSGTYFIEIQTTNGTVLRKVVRE